VYSHGTTSHEGNLEITNLLLVTLTEIQWKLYKLIMSRSEKFINLESY